MIPLFTTEQIRKADGYAINQLGIPGIVLMENASLSIFNAIMHSFPEIEEYKIPIGIVCGKGNNGGDGFAVARHFINQGCEVKIISLGRESELKGDALINYKVAKKLLTKLDESKIVTYSNSKDLSILNGCGVIIDAILGTGSSGDLKEPYNSIVKKLNSFNAIKVAVDIPTGLNISNAGGDVIFEADLTVTLAELKSGLFYEKGYTNCGEVVKGSIGIGNEFFNSMPVNEYLIEPEDALTGLPARKFDSHKYSAGKVLVIAGSGHLPGASFFAANSVLKAGAGSCILAFPKSIKELAQQKLDSSIVFPYEDNGKEYFGNQNIAELANKLKWADVIAMGPGLGRELETLNAVIEILKKYSSKKIVLDADAVYALRKNGYKKLNLRNCILTPHHGEFAEMLGITVSELKSNLLSIGKKFVAQTASYLVLKGAPTIIFNPVGEVFINTVGNSGMAKFGTGDVLTGVLAGIIAQSNNIEEAVTAGVYIHSLTADLLEDAKTEYGFTASDIQESLPSAIHFLRNSIV